MRKEKHIPGGSFTIARKIFTSEVWRKDPMYLKVWIWILGRANHSDCQKNGFYYARGGFVTTYDEIIQAGVYYRNRQCLTPTIKQIRVILQWLENEGMISVKPVRSGLGRTGADPRAATRAYVGIKIIVVNYGTYQDSENYKGRHRGRPSAEQGHNNNNDTNNNEYNSDQGMPETIYELYVSEISPKQKSRQRAIKNIGAHLKKHDAGSLKQSISNYAGIVKSRGPEYRKDPANFFGRQDPAFLDYLPENFKPETSESGRTPDWL